MLSWDANINIWSDTGSKHLSICPIPFVRAKPLFSHSYQPVCRDAIPTVCLRVFVCRRGKLRQLDKRLHLSQPILVDGDLERRGANPRRGG